MPQWRDKAVQDGYEPGSVFKVITAAIALDEKKVSVNDQFYCSGYKQIGGWRIACWKTHGAETFADGFRNSCNSVFMDVGARIGTADFFKYITAFGLREQTGIDLPGEASGYFHKLSDMHEVELATSSFGQTFKITPIQLITAISAVVNGGYLMEPHMVKEFVDPNNNVLQTVQPVVKRQVVSKQTSETMRMLLESVVTSGTGTNAYIKGYRGGRQDRHLGKKG